MAVEGMIQGGVSRQYELLIYLIMELAREAKEAGRHIRGRAAV